MPPGPWQLIQSTVSLEMQGRVFTLLGSLVTAMSLLSLARNPVLVPHWRGDHDRCQADRVAIPTVIHIEDEHAALMKNTSLASLASD